MMETIKRAGNFRRGAHARRPNARPAEGTRTSPEYGLDVELEQRRRLAECCAFFKAEKYREAEPGKLRASDVKEAEAEIDAAIEQCHERAGST
jgi:hypothetical protein